MLDYGRKGHKEHPYTTLSEPELARFHFSFSRNGACWVWTAGHDAYGYGRFSLQRDGRQVHYRAHRLAYMLEHGPFLDDMKVCHTCDNPSCVNPAHLFLGTPADNVKDKMQKGRMRARTGSECNHSKLTAPQVQQIFMLHGRGLSQKQLAIQFGVNQSSVQRILSGENWKYFRRGETC